MPRVAFFLPTLAGGGAERVFLDLASGFARRGAAVDVVVGRAEGDLAGGIEKPVSLVSLDAGRTLACLIPLVQYLRQRRPTALVSALTHANVVAVAAHRLARTPTRLVVTEHLGPTTWIPGSRARRERAAVPLILRFAYRYIDEIVAVSSGVAQDLAGSTGLPLERITVVYNPVMIDELVERADRPVDHPWFALGEPPVILGVGRLTPQKDFPTLLRAFAEVRRREACNLLILGEGDERPTLETLAVELGIADAVRMPGFASNPYPYFRRAAALALSSRFEGLPTVLLEAVCLQVPIVSTDCPSGPREILADGRYGRLVPTGDVGALADALLRTLREQGPRPPAQACEQYQLDAVVERYAAVLGISDLGPVSHV